MKKIRIIIDSVLEYIRRFILLTCLLLALFLTLFIVKGIYDNQDLNVNINLLYFTVGLLIFGIVGDQFINLFGTIIKDRINSYLNQKEGQSILKEHLLSEFKKYSAEEYIKKTTNTLITQHFLDPLFTNKFLETLKENDNFKVLIQDAIAFNSSNSQEKEFNEADSKRSINVSNDRFNTVIVPVGWSLDWNLKYKIYFCQKGRTFRKSEYLALYAARRIHYIGKRISIDIEVIRNKMRQDFEFAESLNEMKIDVATDELDFYDLSVEGAHLSIYHSGPIALTMNQIYSTFSSLKNATTTNEIDREKNTT